MFSAPAARGLVTGLNCWLWLLTAGESISDDSAIVPIPSVRVFLPRAPTRSGVDAGDFCGVALRRDGVLPPEKTVLVVKLRPEC